MADSLRRGFKSEANEIAREVRGELGLGPSGPLDPWKLAAYLSIPLLPLSAMREDAPEAVHHFMAVDTGAFSAVTVFLGPRRLIVYNDRHSRARQASDLAHEMAHALLQHTPGAALDEHGCRIWTAEHEAEADWLAGALLVSDEAALSIVRRELDVASAAREYAVSEAMMKFRLNVTGARRRVRSVAPRRR